jgi:glyoxylase-like metal-dependent hydrolase (beta-lactamase superfamily II)
MNPRGLIERAYDPAHWSHGPSWVLYDSAVKDWYGFQARRILEGVTPEIFLVPLPGHTRGHSGVAIATEDGWLFQCGDAASPLHRETDIHGLEGIEHPADILPGWFVRRFIGPHVSQLRDLIKNHGDEIEVISAHDLHSFSRHVGEAIGTAER